MSKQRTGYVYFDEERRTWTARLTYKDALGKTKNLRRQVANKAEGKQVLKKLLREIEDHGAQILDGDRLSFKELARVYEEKRLFAPTITPSGKTVGLKSYQSARRRLKTLTAHFGAKRIRNITHADIEDYKRERLGTLPQRFTTRRAKLEAKLEILQTKRPRKGTNRTAEIACNVIRDDGTEPAHHFKIEVKLAGEQAVHKGLVKAAEFDLMRWPVVVADARAVIYARKSDHARTAVQLLSSRTAKTRRIVTHTGWRNDSGDWRFYHAGGAVTAGGAVEADVELAGSLASFSLPAPPTGARLREVVRALAFDLPKVAPEQISLPLIGCGPVAILTGADFSLFLIGTTGTGKSELLALLMNFFGKDFNRKNLPAYWESTALSIQEVAHLAKDVVCGVDDFVPKGTAIAQARLHDKAEIVFRGQGNGSGRGRCNSDGSLRTARPSRGLIVSTGEDVPRGQSLQARLLISQVEKSDVQWNEVTACQTQARAGVYAEATSAFIQWLATDNRIEKYQQDAAEKLHELRAGWLESGVDAHKKTATTLAYLQRAWNVRLEFAAECGALDGDEVTGFRESAHAALDALGRAQSRYLLSENPAARFIELLRSALVSGQAHMADINGGKPEVDVDKAFGWRQGEPLGATIGWVDGENVYLQPDAAYRLAQAAAVNGEGLSISAQTLWKRLKEENLLASTDEKRETNTVRRTICRKSESVIHLPLKLFFSTEVGLAQENPTNPTSGKRGCSNCLAQQMAWEQRRNKFYYYRKEWRGGKVVSEYIGKGEMAEAFALCDQSRREERTAFHTADLAEQAWAADIDAEADALFESINTLTEAVLLLTGHHKHKGDMEEETHDGRASQTR